MPSQEVLGKLVERLEKVTCRLEQLSTRPGGSSGSAPSAASEEEAAFVKEYDNLLQGPLNDFLSASNKIGGLVNEQAQLLKNAMQEQRKYLVVASKSKKPTDQKVVVNLLAPTSEKITAILEMKEKNRRSEFFNHLAALAEGVAALAWVTIEPAPSPYVKEMADAGMFYINRVLKDFKEKDQVHVDWTKALQSLWKDLQAYVKQHHTTGLTWNPQGGDAASAKVSSGSKPSAPSAPGAGAPPPPPPGAMPPPPPPGAMPAPSANQTEVDTGALFAEINKGSDITKGLKKVTDDMKTHKNPSLRTGPAPFKPPPTAPKPFSSQASKHQSVSAQKAVPAKKPPVVELQGKKWVVENLVNKSDTVIDDTETKQTVYIYNCVNSTIQVKGKINSITLDSCKKSAVVFDDAISMVEFVNCQSVKAQVLGKVPTVNIEKTDGCQVFLSKDSLDTSFISAKSSEMNVVIPTEDGDYSEYAIAEQFKTVFNGTTLVTAVNDIAA